MLGETNSMVGYHLMTEDIQFSLGSGVWGGGAVSPLADVVQHPGGSQNFLKFLNIGLKKMFEKLKIDTF